MAKKKEEGRCCLCGSEGKLSFEHIPPRSAFNDSTVLEVEFDKLITAESLENLKGKQNQRGGGDYSLCPKCNSLWATITFSNIANGLKNALRYY